MVIVDRGCDLSQARLLHGFSLIYSIRGLLYTASWMIASQTKGQRWSGLYCIGRCYRLSIEPFLMKSRFAELRGCIMPTYCPNVITQVKNPAACCGAASKEKANIGAPAPKPPLAIHPRSKLRGILAFSHKGPLPGIEPQG